MSLRPPSSRSTVSASPCRGPLRLAEGYRLQASQRSLSGPSGQIPLNELGVVVLGLCDGTLDSRSLQQRLQAQVGNAQDLAEFIAVIKARGWVVCDAD